MTPRSSPVTTKRTSTWFPACVELAAFAYVHQPAKPAVVPNRNEVISCMRRIFFSSLETRSSNVDHYSDGQGACAISGVGGTIPNAMHQLPTGGKLRMQI